MPEATEPPPLTDKQEAKWRAEFEGRGPHYVRDHWRGGGYPVQRQREAAERWLREKEAAVELREQLTLVAAVVAAVAAVLGIVLMLAGR